MNNCKGLYDLSVICTTRVHCRRTDCTKSDTRHLGQHACRQELEHLVETASFPLFQDNVDGVKRRVERRVHGEHENNHGHVDLPGDVQAAGSEEAQYADGEPTQEVGHGHGDQAPRDRRFLVLLVSAGLR